MKKIVVFCVIAAVTPLVLLFTTGCKDAVKAEAVTEKEDTIVKQPVSPGLYKSFDGVDTADYNRKMLTLSNNDTTGKWPVATPYPLAGALLPYNRIVAYYGNLYSKRMGILGEIPRDSMLEKLQSVVAEWNAADPDVPAIPALHYVATTAQGSPGKDRKHRLRMPFHQIDTVMSYAKRINALVFVDIQVGHSTVKDEVSALETYLKLPNVHLGIDPEFSMKNGEVPGSKIGTFSASDINDAIDILADIVRKNNLPPKVLVIHRFTQGMVTGYEKIKKLPEVQVVMDMDGFGDKTLKRSSYLRYIFREPVQFTGFKIFYKNDNTPKAGGMYSPSELLHYTPRPIYIQYQ